MQLMTFNSLLMFDIVFIFFLFLVGVTCLVYYLPPRELTPHDASTQPQQPSSCSGFPSPASGGPLVRGCASTARRISGEGGTPIILVGVRSEAEQQQQQHQQQQQQQQQNQQQQESEQEDWSPTAGRRYGRVLTADSVRADPDLVDAPATQLYPYPLRMGMGGRTDRCQLERPDEQEVLLFDCTLEDLIALRRMATLGGEMRPGSGSEPCRNCCCQYQPSVDRWSSPPNVPLPPSPPPRIIRRGELHYPVEEGDDEEEEDEEEGDRVEYVRIEIERSTSGKCNATNGTEPSMPACCYVRAKNTDIRACSGPIHDV